ncbi:MAG TPA: hypothetical protein VGB99_08820 [Acidobacteriota bacterium]
MPPKTGKKPSPYSIYWEEVSTTTLKLYLGGILLVGLIVGLMIWQRDTPLKRARNEILSAKQLISEVTAINPEALGLDPLPQRKLDEAQRHFSASDFKASYSLAIESQRASRDLLGKLSQGGRGSDKAYLIAMEGVIQVRRAGTTTWTDGHDNMPLAPGDEIRSAEKASAQVVFFNGADYTIKGDSLIKIQESYQNPVSKEKNVAVQVSSGQVDLSTSTFPAEEGASRVKISSPTSVATVGESSNALLSYDEKRRETNFTLYRGSANLQHGGREFKVGARQALTLQPGFDAPQRTDLPLEPRILSPESGKVFELEARGEQAVNFLWSETGGSARYDFQLSKTKLFADPVREATELQTSTYAIRGLEPGPYFWRVRSRSATGHSSEFTLPVSFEVQLRRHLAGTIDRSPPEIEIDSLVPFGPHVLIIGRTEAGATVTANSKPLVINEDGTFRDLVSIWKTGRNRISFQAIDPAGNSTILEKFVHIETLL